MGGAERRADAELPSKFPPVAGEEFIGLSEHLFMSSCCLAETASCEEISCCKAGWEELPNAKKIKYNACACCSDSG